MTGGAQMQSDMHYYGTYAMARAAGLDVEQARVIAYAAQYVDDSTANNSEVHRDGGMFQCIATAHSNSEAIENAAADHTEQRQVWVPFHFFPGGEGKTLSKKLVCVKDGALAREMVDNHIRHAVSVRGQYGLALMGIMAHVYADTFSHYGFSGVSSRNNKVDGTSFQLHVHDPAVKAYIMGKFTSFLSKYTPHFLIRNYRNIVSRGASVATGALGHGAVGTYPDRPFLRWSFSFKKGQRDSGLRDNQATFLEGCEKLHAAFSTYADQLGMAVQRKPFGEIRDKVKEILALEAPKAGRIQAWTDAISGGELFDATDDERLLYSHHEWEQQKQDFEDLKHAYEMRDKEVYQFHQAAIYHRDYTLKNLLPKHAIVVL